MNIGIDIRCLMDKNRTGVGEYTFGLLDNVFKHTDSTDGGEDYTDSNQYFLFYNSNKDVSANLPKWDYENVHYVGLSWPNKVLNLLLFFKVLKLDNVISRKYKAFESRASGRGVESIKYNKSPLRGGCRGVLDVWFSPNLNFTNLSKSVRHIQTIHDLSFEFFPEYFTWKQRLWHWFLNPRKQCQKADVIVVPSENTRRDVEAEFGVPPFDALRSPQALEESSKFRVLRPGLLIDIGHKTEDIRHKYILPEKYILYLGTLEPRKNVETIIEAYNKAYSLFLIPYSLVIAGASGWKNKKLMRLIKQTPGVKYLGYVDEEDKLALYKNASLFVFPSFYEGFGLPVLEAMACGVPVITSNRSSLMEVGQDAVCYVSPYNVSELAGAMVGIVKNEDLRLKIIERQLEVIRDYDWEKTARQFIKLCNSGL